MRQPAKGRTTKQKTRSEKTPETVRTGSGWTVSSITNSNSSPSNADTTQRSPARGTSSRRRRSTSWLPVLEFVVLVGLLFGLGHFLLTNPRFTIRQVNIDGNQSVDVQQLATAAEVPPHSNIFVFLIKQRSEFCRRVVASDPVIQKASLGIEFPNAVRLHIVERVPVSVLHLQNGASYLMDEDRVAYRVIAPNQSDLPVVTVPASPSPIVKGKSLPPSVDNEVLAAFNLMELISEREIGPLSDYRELIVDPYDNVSLLLHCGLLIKLGQADGLGDRLSLVETVLTADPSLPTKAEYLDFTTSRPAIMPKQPPLTKLSGGEPKNSAAKTEPISTDIGQ